MNCDIYSVWYHSVRPALAQGAWLRLPASAPHPSACGFETIIISEPHGQVADWGTPTPGGSRLHVHEHAEGTLVAHEDRFSPDEGPLSMLAHVLFETKAGKAALVVAGAAVIVKVAAALLE